MIDSRLSHEWAARQVIDHPKKSGHALGHCSRSLAERSLQMAVSGRVPCAAVIECDAFDADGGDVRDAFDADGGDGCGAFDADGGDGCGAFDADGGDKCDGFESVWTSRGDMRTAGVAAATTSSAKEAARAAARAASRKATCSSARHVLKATRSP